jgi:hypothetical protein
MSLTDENGNMSTTMLVSPTGGVPYYGGNMGGGFGNSFGGDWGWIILLLLLAGGGWGNGFGGGFGGGQLGYDFPWLMNGQQGINNNVSDGFRDAQLHDSVTSVRDGISALSTQLCGCCGDIQNSLCNGFNGVNMSVNNAQNAIAQQLYTNQIADLNRSFDAQTATTAGMNAIGMSLQNCCCENRAATADLKYTIATENCADRAALSDGVRDIIASQTAGTQRILDKLCDQELQAERRDNANLRSELMYARGQASQIEQTAQIRAGQNAAVTSLVNELRSCPIPAQPVYGSQPIFTCPSNNTGCGCGCGNF